MSAKSNPLDRATLPNWIEWGKKNWGYIALVASFLGYNGLKPEPELPPITPQKAVQFTDAEFSNFYIGMQQACAYQLGQQEKKWPQKRK